MFCKDCRAGVAFFLGVIPVLVVARQIKCDLSFLQLGFLDAEKIGICGMKIIEKSFCTQARSPLTFHEISFISDVLLSCFYTNYIHMGKKVQVLLLLAWEPGNNNQASEKST